MMQRTINILSIRVQIRSNCIWDKTITKTFSPRFNRREAVITQVILMFTHR